ncbi:MAG TPA: M28 family peptidase [Pyrinomonadaceae bacterium]|nr:M28 family peptidase [Pyrinomonadaceae bacterium]
MLKRSLAQFLFVTCLVLGSYAQNATKTTYDSKHLASLIDRITAGDTTEDRSKAIRDELADIKVRISTEGFTRKSREGDMVSGTNIIGEVSNPTAKRMIMIGAHYDRVRVGKGAVDNASGSAAVLLLLRAFKEAPLKNIRLQGAFWDHEEQGLHGSRIYVENRKEKGLPDIYINFDVYGYGDTLWLWSANEATDFVKAVINAGANAKFNAVRGSVYPSSDHRSFHAGGVETYSFSLLSANEVREITSILGGTPPEPGKMPKALATIHTAADTKDKIDAAAVVKSLAVVEAAIRALDK